jgi:hypothetical protein
MEIFTQIKLHDCVIFYADHLGSIMVRTMLRRDGNAEKFWFVARPCATGKQLAAVSDICTSSPFVDSSAPVHVVPFPAVEHFRAHKDLQRKDGKQLLHKDSFMNTHCQINKSAICCANRVFCIGNGKAL